jgi:hypothetical protein
MHDAQPSPELPPLQLHDDSALKLDEVGSAGAAGAARGPPSPSVKRRCVVLDEMVVHACAGPRLNVEMGAGLKHLEREGAWLSYRLHSATCI